MARFVWFLGLAPALVALACAPKATEADCRAACEKQVNLETPAAPGKPESAVGKLEDEFGAKIDEAMRARAAALKALDEEAAAKVAAVAKEEEKAPLVAEHAARRAAREAELDQPIDELAKQKEVAIEAAREAESKARAELQARHEDAVQTCARACLAAETKKPTTDCRQNAMSLAEFNACR